MGWLNLALYLKAASVCLMRFYGGEFHRHEAVSLTRSGIPRCIPPFHRKMLMARDEKADKLVKFYLSIFSLSKLILVKKRDRLRFENIVSFPTSFQKN